VVLFANFYFSHKHSAFTSSFPIYLFETWTENVPVEDETSGAENSPPVSESPVPESSDDEAIVEEVLKEDEKAPKTKTVTKEQWNHLNSQPPLWARFDLYLRYAFIL
jgi:heat shock protein beta